jgi:hypothetical protein
MPMGTRLVSLEVDETFLEMRYSVAVKVPGQ